MEAALFCVLAVIRIIPAVYTAYAVGFTWISHQILYNHGGLPGTCRALCRYYDVAARKVRTRAGPKCT